MGMFNTPETIVHDTVVQIAAVSLQAPNQMNIRGMQLGLKIPATVLALAAR